MISIYVDNNAGFPGRPEQEIAATIGFFDGVHRGHRFLIEQLKRVATEANLPSAVMTFPVHPRKALQSDYQPELLNNFDEKLFQLSTTGIDYCLVMDFTLELSGLTAETFIKEKLRKALSVKKLLIGYDHKFGKGRVDGFEDYKMYGETCGIEVVRAEQLKEKDLHISSTSIRKLLAEGDVKGASGILSYNYALEGVVIHGNRMGRELGFPTANLNITEPYKVVPAEGIYATLVHLGGETYQSMTYIGNRPTILSGGEQRIEAHLFDFSGDLYDKNVRIEFVDYIRPDIRFDSIEKLKGQMQNDKQQAVAILRSHASIIHRIWKK